MIENINSQQVASLIEIVSKNIYARQIIDSSESLFGDIAPWYLAAGCISQSVWNYLSGRDPIAGIKDYDLIYYDAGDISYAAEDIFIRKGTQLFKSWPVEVEIRNQARVHVWFAQHFGYPIDPLRSCEEAISGWPATVTCVGITKTNGRDHVYAPYGLDDVFDMVLRPHPSTNTRSKAPYEKKVEKWTKIWPALKVVPW